MPVTKLRGSHDQLLPSGCINIILYSDPEGDLTVFNQTRTRGLALIDLVMQDPMPPVYLSLGDMVDKGADDLGVLNSLKECTGENKSLWIAGNRDKNKIRFLQELLNDDHLNNILERNLPPHWDSIPANKPQAFLINLLIKNEKQHHGFIEEIKRAYQALPDKTISFEEMISELATDKNKFPPQLLKAYSALDKNWKRVFAAHWMLEKTMGSPHKFSLRKDNLHRYSNIPEREVTDTDVVTSFIEEMLTPDETKHLRKRGQLPEQPVLKAEFQGLMQEYLEKSCEVIVIGKTIFSHGALTSDNIFKNHEGKPFRDPAKVEGDRARDYLLEWVSMYNQEYQDLLRKQIAALIDPDTFELKNQDLSKGVGLDLFNRSALPPGEHNKHNVTTGKHIPDGRAEPLVGLDTATAELLKNAEITLKCHGHVSVGCFGTVVEESGIKDWCIDTAISKWDPKTNQSRDGSENTAVILNAASNVPRAMMSGKANNSQGGFEFRIDLNNPEHFIGRVVSIDNQLYRVTGYDCQRNNFFLIHREVKGGYTYVPQADEASGPKRLSSTELKEYFEKQKQFKQGLRQYSLFDSSMNGQPGEAVTQADHALS